MSIISDLIKLTVRILIEVTFIVFVEIPAAIIKSIRESRADRR